MKRTLAARPDHHDYLAEIRQRCGTQPLLADPLELARRYGANNGSTGARKPYEMAEGIAFINISGFLTADARWWDETGYDEIVDEVEMAVADPDVKGILLRVDSAGGEVTKAFETARGLAEAGKKKPMWTAVDPYAYSAAYMLACCAERIYVLPDSGGVGSIGVYSMHVDMSKALDKMGVAITFISAGKGKTDGNPYEPLSDSARKRFAAEVNRYYETFVGFVAERRKMPAERIVKELGAGLFNGRAQAIASGLATHVGSLADAWVEMANFVQQKSFTSVPASADTTLHKEVPKMERPDNPADTSTKPDTAAVDAAKKEGFAQAAEIVALCELAGRSDRASAFISAGASVAQVRSELLAEKVNASESNTIQNATLPEQGMKANSNGLIAACERLAAEKMAQAKGGR